MITLLILIPILSIPFLLVFKDRKALGVISFGFALANFFVSVYLLQQFDFQKTEFQFVESVLLVPNFSFYYKVGIDSISLWMVLLTTFLFPLVITGAYDSIKDKFQGYYISLMILESSIIGAFVSLDLFLFYIFWELMLIPMFFIIGLWGGKDRIYATVKFVLFTMVGSLLMLIGIIYFIVAYNTFDYEKLLQIKLSFTEQAYLFWLFAAAFLIKVPVAPVHTWLPDAHTEAPAGGSVILAGILLKLGTFGLIRYNLPLFPEASLYFANLLAIIAVIGIVHGAFAAAVQPDIKRLIAYSSVSHMGFIVLGIFSFTVSGIQGSILQMINHALSTGALFFLVGMIYEHTHTRFIADYGGAAKWIPLYAVFFMISTLSSVGLPGLNGFVGEFTILVSSYKVYPVLTIVAVSGVVLGAWYLLKAYGKVFYGESRNEEVKKHLKDMNLREMLTLIPMVILMFYLGLFPKPFFQSIEASVKQHLEHLQKVNKE
ncbi:MAG: NADH-quinone oxidoreductase subunit M [Leptospiraceae bacterium]|nr:NADH-quinone oxidoreductase subunit M [Leptospiraceae bacterium]MDW7975838.1 NADH-quinone oxidoreductase subunit M [Leptospiraceae bacterium]